MKVETQKVVSFTITLSADEARDLSHVICEARELYASYYSDWMKNLEDKIDSTLDEY